MPTNTYVALDKVTVSGTSTPSITFNSIPQTYTDLVIIVQAGATVSTQELKVVLNNDTTTNYSNTIIWGNGSTAGSVRRTSQTGWILDYQGGLTTDVAQNVTRINIMDYANATTFKTAIVRADSTSISPEAMVCLWRKTPEAINTVKIECLTGNFASGSTFSLYGIAAASVGAKATGGTVYSDSQYYYHVFGSTGTFTPLQSLATEMLVVGAGGGGSGGTNGANYGSAGASGIVSYSSQTMSSATAYTCTVGAGGAGAIGAGSNGASSSITGTGITTVTATAGNGAGTGRTGGANASFSGGTASANFDGGGGAGSAANGSLIQGGAGTNSYSTWLTAIGLGVSGYIAGGGSGGGFSPAVAGGAGGGGAGRPSTASGLVNTGSGGGGNDSANAGGSGGSGVVIVRYAK